MALKVEREYVHLSWRDQEHHKVVVTPEDEDRFLLTVQAAIQACRAHEKQLQFQKQFERVLTRLGAWIDEHEDAISQAYVTIRDAGLLFLVVRRQTEYERAFEDELSQLDIEIAQDKSFDLIRLSVLALPMASKSAIDSFMGSDLSLAYPIAD